MAFEETFGTLRRLELEWVSPVPSACLPVQVQGYKHETAVLELKRVVLLVNERIRREVVLRRDDDPTQRNQNSRRADAPS